MLSSSSYSSPQVSLKLCIPGMTQVVSVTAVIEVICSEETQNNPRDKYTEEFTSVQVCTPMYRHFIPKGLSFLGFIPQVCTCHAVSQALPCLHRVALLTMKQILGHAEARFGWPCFLGLLLGWICSQSDLTPHRLTSGNTHRDRAPATEREKKPSGES